MTAFNDDDLERLKDFWERKGGGSACDCMTEAEFKALLARLEAASVLAEEYAEQCQWLCPACSGVDGKHHGMCLTDKKIQAWRKACGR
jgi:hypothetical protein